MLKEGYKQLAMDEETVRQHMEEVRERLGVIQEESTALRLLLKGYERWLRFYGSPFEQPQTKLLDDAVTDSFPPKGSPTLREAVRQVVEDAEGEPLHCTEIWDRAKRLGAMTTGEDPVAVVDFTTYTLKGVQRVGHRTWRWAGGTISKDEEIDAAKHLQRMLHGLKARSRAR